ncbi:MGC80088 protein, putative [Brugia malayi]|uniref:Transmembrane protein 98 n=1 Tax=Brugia malayi TaxID=6279 RepID=A0A0K0JGZ2_BRUMA|nr:MGC80088 protein, putative [Brugia malayi]CRZ23118.1 Bm4978 [Brugia malayi]VIO95556.1 MGC80088 protein, putative [Brugia malayi]
MEVVVYLALFVLASVFCFSSFILIVMCRRRAQARERLHAAMASLSFTKVNNENVESVLQLGPLIAQVLDSNQWIYDVSGMLQHCVVVLKLCHALTEKLSVIQLNSIAPKLNEQVVTATARIMPRFDDLIRTVAANQVDIRLLEARASSLVSACWALAFPFTVISPKHMDSLDGVLNEMEDHVEALRLIVGHMEENFMVQDKNCNQKLPSSLAVVEETPLMESSTNRNDSITDSLHSDEAPADPMAPTK